MLSMQTLFADLLDNVFIETYNVIIDNINGCKYYKRNAYNMGKEIDLRATDKKMLELVKLLTPEELCLAIGVVMGKRIVNVNVQKGDIRKMI
jgi:hypothetical protein